jgi:uncharacterized OB-fold protein
VNIDLPAVPLPERDALSEPYWAALDGGRHIFQRCTACAHAWLPARGECPRCLSAHATWETAGGDARLISWVVYHTAFHPAFKARLPYTVAVVELSEGPRLITNIIGSDDPETLRIDQPLRLVIERESGVAVPRYAVAVPLASVAVIDVVAVAEDEALAVGAAGEPVAAGAAR